MKQKKLIIVAFLLMLYMIPSVTAGYGDISPQSITSISETLPDDVLFYPDAIINDTVHVADTGDDDYADSRVLDSTYWTADEDTLEEAEYHLSTTLQIECFSYAFYGESTGANAGWLKIQNDADAWVILETIATGGDSWYNGTVADPDYFKTDNEIHLGIEDYSSDFTTVECDYLEITYVSYMTLADSEHHAESFTDVSEWVLGSAEASEAFSTDGDVCTFSAEGDSGNDVDFIYHNDISLSPDNWDYIEFRYKMNSTTSDYWQIWLQSEETTARDKPSLFTGDLTETTSWTTFKIHKENLLDGLGGSDGTIENILIAGRNDAGVDVSFYIDYLRISPANETGWQHDGSTTQGITTGYYVSTDGEELNFTNNVDGVHTWDVYVDTTSTIAKISTSYYPFLEISITGLTDGDSDGRCWLLRAYEDSGTYENVKAYGIETGILRFNVAALAAIDSIYRLRFYMQDEGDSITIDYVKLYSIANFTVTQSGIGIDDYFYVDSNILYSNIDEGYIVANHDPTLDLSHYQWNMNTSLGTPEVDFYNGAWLGYSSEIEGEFSIGTTVTDIRLKFTDNANIISLKFTDRTGWNIVNTVVVIFSMALFTGSLDALFIFLGLLMIPASTLFLVHGKRSEMSMDKLFYGLIAFAIGWALFLGGIFG